jgi:small subunit ribosomal protein S11
MNNKKFVILCYVRRRNCIKIFSDFKNFSKSSRTRFKKKISKINITKISPFEKVTNKVVTVPTFCSTLFFKNLTVFKKKIIRTNKVRRIHKNFNIDPFSFKKILECSRYNARHIRRKFKYEEKKRKKKYKQDIFQYVSKNKKRILKNVKFNNYFSIFWKKFFYDSYNYKFWLKLSIFRFVRYFVAFQLRKKFFTSKKRYKKLFSYYTKYRRFSPFSFFNSKIKTYGYKYNSNFIRKIKPKLDLLFDSVTYKKTKSFSYPNRNSYLIISKKVFDSVKISNFFRSYTFRRMGFLRFLKFIRFNSFFNFFSSGNHKIKRFTKKKFSAFIPIVDGVSVFENSNKFCIINSFFTKNIFFKFCKKRVNYTNSKVNRNFKIKRYLRFGRHFNKYSKHKYNKSINFFDKTFSFGSGELGRLTKFYKTYKLFSKVYKKKRSSLPFSYITRKISSFFHYYRNLKHFKYNNFVSRSTFYYKTSKFTKHFYFFRRKHKLFYSAFSSYFKKIYRFKKKFLKRRKKFFKKIKINFFLASFLNERNFNTFKKERNFVSLCHSKNNFFIYVHNTNGKIIYQSSNGLVGYRGPKKPTAFAAEMNARKVARAIRYSKISPLVLVIRTRLTSFVRSAIRGINYIGIKFSYVKRIILKGHNGLRKPGSRRV